MLKVIVTPSPTFTIEIEGTPLQGFTVESFWEGFVKLRHPDGYIIVEDDTDFFSSYISKIFQDLFGESPGKMPEFTVVKLSGKILNNLSKKSPA